MRKTLIALAGLALAAAPLSAAHAVDYSVTASVPEQAELGNAVTIRGHVDGVTTKGFTVDIHAYYISGKGEVGPGEPPIVHVGHPDVHSSGNFARSYTPPKGGGYLLMFKVLDKHGETVAEGGEAPLLVYRWTALQNLNMAPGEETPANYAGKTTGKTVAGRKWSHELFLRDNASLHFDWDVPCSKVQSYVGISDSAPNGTTATTNVHQQGAEADLITLDQTRGAKARHFTRDLVGSPSLNLSTVFGEGTDTVGKKVIFGEPKAYCAIG